MKTIHSLVALVMLAAPVVHAEITIPCEVGYVFCMDELTSIAANSKNIESLIEQLPVHVKQNLTLKRGNNIEKTINGKKEILGPHGHLAPAGESQSATPEQPRAFVWDEKSGFTASWNSGNPAHTAFDRIDLYDFDFSKNEHRLMSWTSKDGFADKNLKDQNGRSCVQCHGEAQRPIFPMYPDWPQFYGEFNDEFAGYGPKENALRKDLKIMANEFQPKERALYADFLANEAESNKRYSLLFDVIPDYSKAIPGYSPDDKYYPFRPKTTTSPSTDISRAFAHRPNLRLGVLYNRLTALATFEKLKKSKVFRKFPDVIFYALLDCNWDFTEGKGETERSKILNTFLTEVRAMDEKFAGIDLRGAQFSAEDLDMLKKADLPKLGYIEEKVNGKSVYYRHKKYTDKDYRQIPYEDLLKLVELDVRDLDIRFRHDSSIKVAGKFNVYDPKAYYFTKSAMDIGYSENTYSLNPICNNAGDKCLFSYKEEYMKNMKYFNSYFDGSATMNELLAAQILIFLTDTTQDFSNDPDLAQVREILRKNIKDPTPFFETLNKKYSNFEDRLKLDKTFFARMDMLSPWLQLPYPPDLLNVHNRESFWGTSTKTTAIRLRHAQWKNATDRKKDVRNLNGGQNVCWNVYDSMKARFK